LTNQNLHIGTDNSILTVTVVDHT